MNTQNTIGTSDNLKEIWIVGFRIDPNYTEPDFYTILLEERDDQPISHDEQIIFFHKIHDAQIALEFDSLYSTMNNCNAPNEVYCVLDVAQSLYLIYEQSIDNSAEIVSFLNVLFDLLKSVSIQMPTEYKTILFKLADHLTFNREFGDFIEAEGITRKQLIEAIQWGVGAVITKSTFVPKNQPV